jgi:hypothetical protein
MPESKIKLSETQYQIHIPIFISERNKIEGFMFDYTYNHMIESIKVKVLAHNASSRSIVTPIRHKTIKRVIDEIMLTQSAFGDTPYLILQISAYNSNIEGQIIKKEKVLNIEQADKVGSNKNFMLLYPQISITDDVKYCNWVVLVYDDPDKKTDDNISNAKTLMRYVLDAPIKNIKLKKFIEDLKGTDMRPFINLTLTNVSFDEDRVSDKLAVYQISSKSTSKVEYEFHNMPFEDMESLILDDFENKYLRKILKFRFGRREYKINQNLTEFRETYDSSVEQHFNFTQSIPESNIESLYESEFMTGLMERVLSDYLTNSENGL